MLKFVLTFTFKQGRIKQRMSYKIKQYKLIMKLLLHLSPLDCAFRFYFGLCPPSSGPAAFAPMAKGQGVLGQGLLLPIAKKRQKDGLATGQGVKQG
jgi:hypothetical protein